jgi:hypothetical protein
VQEAMMRVSGAGRYDAYGYSSQQVLSASYSNDTSLLTTTSSSSTDPGASLFGSASATNLFSNSGSPFGDSVSLFGSDSSSSTSDAATEINALRSRITSQQTRLTNLNSVTLEGVAQKSNDYIAESNGAAGGAFGSSGLGALINKLA